VVVSNLCSFSIRVSPSTTLRRALSNYMHAFANTSIESPSSRAMEQNTKTLADYLDLVKRRKYYIVVTWLLVSVTSVIVAYNLPKIYRSTATMLIEAPIPTNLVESTISQFADEQIQSIYQRVMATDNVLSIIDANGLYKDIKMALRNMN